MAFKHLLGLEGLSREQITRILDQAVEFKEISKRKIKKVPTLRGITIALFFVEASTRTRTSFEIAAKRLSADTISLTASASSLSKGETLIDTTKNLEAMAPDIFIIRHSVSGSPHMLSKILSCSVVNAGDGTHEHPTQGLLDMMTMREHKGGIEGLDVAIIGDIMHSRVARSNIFGLTAMGAKVRISGPATLVPRDIEKLGVTVCKRVEEAVEGSDVVMMLRIQKERMAGDFFPTTREYSREFGLNLKRLSLAKKDAIVMHPGPMNRGVEISPDVADGTRSVILDQVANGVAVRMAVLYLLSAHVLEGV
ncbi:MAG: aspartate carbamoyltransferase catalytic subunit [Deltaproteobacteria bacterium]|nr:aspartate carbamoyltransferase catalytic subunit [Deltaproteobacteria bacterium]